jgi:ferredoxin
MLKTLAILFLVLAPLKWVYVVDKGACNGCGNCVYFCPLDAISMHSGDAFIDPEICNGCGICVNYCPRNAIYREWYTGIEEEGTCEGLSISENPASSPGITVAGIKPGFRVKITDWTGRVLMEGCGDEQGFLLVDLTDVPAGVYLVVSGETATVLTII